jgi:hypothetical protein
LSHADNRFAENRCERKRPKAHAVWLCRKTSASDARTKNMVRIYIQTGASPQQSFEFEFVATQS